MKPAKISKNIKKENPNLKNEEIKSLFLQMLDAVGYVHAQNLVHRDIKPSNFMIDKNGNVKLMDFGISKSTDKTSVEYTQTGTGVQMGTPMYMSPEQITETKSVTAQSDIYSLGVVLWQMVMGERPYDIKELSTFQLQMKIVQEELPKTNTHWDLIIHQATKKEIADRFTNCKAIIERINENNSSEETVLLENFKVTKTILYSAEKTILANSTQKNLEHINEFEVSGIEIGNQLWMNKNLSQETFQNGDMLFFASNQSEWLDAINNKIQAYCFYNFNKDLSKSVSKDLLL
jgi:serine/threonine protein kinase